MASEESQIRKFRKKLRQIEHLESVRRELTSDEIKKIATKDSIRAQLQILLSQIIEESEAPRTSHVSRTRFKLPESPNEQLYSNGPPASNLEDTNHLGRSGNEHSQPKNNSSETATMKKRKRDVSELENLQNENNESRVNGKQPREEIFVEQQNTLGEASSVPSTSHSNEDVRRKYRELEHSKVVVKELKGHSDVVWALSCVENILVSGSRDTTARVWDLENGNELCSLRGHTGSVNGVALLSLETSREIASKLECDNVNQVVVTASSDCSLRLWTVPSGTQLKFLYTFNSITCLGVVEHLFFAVTGTDGGKIEVWDIISGSAIYSNKAHSESVTCLEVKGSQFCSGSSDGMVIIWAVADRKIQTLYQLSPDTQRELPHIKSLMSVASHYGRLFLGDSESTIKVLSWRRDRMHAVRNHTRNYGFTNALITFEDLLVSSGYNLDSGFSSINIRLLPEVEYICSLHEQARKVLCLACSWNKNGRLCIISGGEELLIWDFTDASYKQNVDRYDAADVVDACHLEMLNLEPDKNDIEEASGDTTDDERDSLENLSAGQNANVQVVQHNWTSWCTLL